MKVLILHQHFNTPEQGGAIRSYYLARALVDHGIHTTVITAYNGAVEKTENVEGIEVHYLPIAYDNRFGFYKRSVSFIQYILKSVSTAGALQGVDVCYAISVPLTIGIAALWIKKRYKIPYIFEVGDLWPEAPIQMGVVKSYFLKEILFDLEKRIYTHAESVVALSTAIQSAVQQKVPFRTVHLISNMSDTEFYQPQQKDIQLQQKYGVENKFVVSYIGAIGLANGLDYFIECARASQKASLPVHFILCGDGAMKERLAQIAKNLQLSNLSILPFTNRAGVKDVMNITDASFICYKPLPVLETGSPNKYFDGLASGKLILLNFGGWIKEETELYNCGVSLDARQPADFVKQITPYLQDSEKAKKSQLASRKLAEEKYSRIQLSERFAHIFQELNSASSR